MTASDDTTEHGKFSALIWILGIGLVVRFVVWWFWKDLPVQIADAQHYDQLATSIVENGSYASLSGTPTSIRPPAYPAFLAGLYFVFGVKNYAAVRLVQGLLSLGTAVLVYFLGTRLFDRRVGLWSCAAFTFYPTWLGFNNLLLSETLFTFLLTAVTWLTVVTIRRDRLAYAATLGILLGIGALTRSILWLFAPLLGVFLVFAWQGTRRRGMLGATAMFACFAATIFPWAYRNTQLEKTVTIVDCMGGRNAMMGNYEYTPLERSWATIDIVKGDQAWHRVLASQHADYPELTQGQIDKLAMKHGIAYVLKHPLLTAKRDIVRFFNFWQLERTLLAGAAAGLFGDISKWVLLPAAALICGSYALAMFAFLFGVLMIRSNDRPTHYFLLISILFPCLIHTLIFAHSRYHLPVIPFVLLYSTAALLNLPELWRRRHEWSFKLAILACCLLTAGWLREVIMVDLSKSAGLLS